VFGADGKLYGMTIYGGRNGRGTVYSLDPASKEFRAIYDFAPDPISATDNAPLQSLFLASNGTLYGTNEYGGPNGTGFVFKVVGNEVTILHEFGIKSADAIPRFSNGDGSLPLSTLTEGADGMIYGTTYYGGANGAGTIFRIAKDGTRFESLYSFLPGHDPMGTGSYPATGLVRMLDGSMVGTTFLGGIGYGVVYRLTLPPSVTIHPDPITAIRMGRGILSRRASGVVLYGQAPYSYSWSIDSGAFTRRRLYPLPSRHATPQKGTCPSPSQTRLVGAQARPPSFLIRPRVLPGGLRLIEGIEAAPTLSPAVVHCVCLRHVHRRIRCALMRANYPATTEKPTLQFGANSVLVNYGSDSSPLVNSSAEFSTS
jgi:uncharacterized repeat protein (TIGR03803 family)